MARRKLWKVIIINILKITMFNDWFLYLRWFYKWNPNKLIFQSNNYIIIATVFILLHNFDLAWSSTTVTKRKLTLLWQKTNIFLRCVSHNFANATDRPPVLFGHGLLQSSDDFSINHPNQSLSWKFVAWKCMWN